MNIWKLYREQGRRGILVQALAGVLAGIVIGVAYVLITGDHRLGTFAIPLFGVPMVLTILKLLLLLGQPRCKSTDQNDSTHTV
jgi:hypothetical protein